MKKLIYSFCLLTFSWIATAQDTSYKPGEIMHFEKKTDLDHQPAYTVWASETALRNPNKKILIFTYADGLFYPKNTPDNESMQIDNMLYKLARDKFEHTVIVGLNIAYKDQAASYIPKEAFMNLPKEAIENYTEMKVGKEDFLTARLFSDLLLDYVEQTILPEVRQKYNASSKASDVYLIGTEYGGLFAMYAAAKRPQTFTKVATISTNWLATPSYEKSDIFKAILKEFEANLPAGKKGPAVYTYMSTEGYDSFNGVFQEQINEMLKTKKIPATRIKHVENSEKPSAFSFSIQAIEAYNFLEKAK